MQRGDIRAIELDFGQTENDMEVGTQHGGDRLAALTSECGAESQESEWFRVKIKRVAMFSPSMFAFVRVGAVLGFDLQAWLLVENLHPCELDDSGLCCCCTGSSGNFSSPVRDSLLGFNAEPQTSQSGVLPVCASQPHAPPVPRRATGSRVAPSEQHAARDSREDGVTKLRTRGLAVAWTLFLQQSAPIILVEDCVILVALGLASACTFGSDPDGLGLCYAGVGEDLPSASPEMYAWQRVQAMGVIWIGGMLVCLASLAEMCVAAPS